jgi:hypothetical protein
MRDSTEKVSFNISPGVSEAAAFSIAFQRFPKLENSLPLW